MIRLKIRLEIRHGGCARLKIKLPLLLLHHIAVFLEIPFVSRSCFQVVSVGQGIDIICVHDERGNRKDLNQRLVYNELWHYDVILRYYVAVL